MKKILELELENLVFVDFKEPFDVVDINIEITMEVKKWWDVFSKNKINTRMEENRNVRKSMPNKEKMK